MDAETAASTEPLTNTDEFFCGHCLELVEATDYPAECLSCHMGDCSDCRTRVKHGAKFCHGCGVIAPKVIALMYRSSSFSGFYASERWAREGLLCGQDFYYSVRSGWETAEDMDAKKPFRVMLARHFFDERAPEVVRDLTDEERVAMGYKVAMPPDGNRP